jgi:hypothetical protein
LAARFQLEIEMPQLGSAQLGKFQPELITTNDLESFGQQVLVTIFHFIQVEKKTNIKNCEKL